MILSFDLKSGTTFKEKEDLPLPHRKHKGHLKEIIPGSNTLLLNFCDENSFVNSIEIVEERPPKV